MKTSSTREFYYPEYFHQDGPESMSKILSFLTYLFKIQSKEPNKKINKIKRICPKYNSKQSAVQPFYKTNAFKTMKPGTKTASFYREPQKLQSKLSPSQIRESLKPSNFHQNATNSNQNQCQIRNFYIQQVFE